MSTEDIPVARSSSTSRRRSTCSPVIGLSRTRTLGLAAAMRGRQCPRCRRTPPPSDPATYSVRTRTRRRTALGGTGRERRCRAAQADQLVRAGQPAHATPAVGSLPVVGDRPASSRRATVFTAPKAQPEELEVLRLDLAALVPVSPRSSHSRSNSSRNANRCSSTAGLVPTTSTNEIGPGARSVADRVQVAVDRRLDPLPTGPAGTV